MTRTDPDLQFEHQFNAEGKQFVAGVDEVGRGALAGPVFAGAVILPFDDVNLISRLSGVRDSKQCTARQRVRLSGEIRQVAVAVSVGMAASEEIDRLGIAPATRLAMARAVTLLSARPEALLIDYVRLPSIPLPQRSFPKGDQRSLSIAAASIIAKVARDELMQSYHSQFPEFGFDRHKGYGTSDHLNAIVRHGPCPIHRLSFSPFRPTLIPELHENSPRP